MIRSMTLTFLVVLVSACSTVPERKDNLIGLKSETPAMVRGERLTSPELAATLAELVLASQGHDCAGWLPSISFCEGVYRITFRPERESDPGKRYEVDIDASNSEVLRVVLAVAGADTAGR